MGLDQIRSNNPTASKMYFSLTGCHIHARAQAKDHLISISNNQSDKPQIICHLIYCLSETRPCKTSFSCISCLSFNSIILCTPLIICVYLNDVKLMFNTHMNSCFDQCVCVRVHLIGHVFVYCLENNSNNMTIKIIAKDKIIYNIRKIT